MLAKCIDINSNSGSNHLFQGEKSVEIVIGFTGYRKDMEQFKPTFGPSPVSGEHSMNLELRLIKDIVCKNRGIMKSEVNESKTMTLISLRFPIERRKVVNYSSQEVLP